ncbi:MAG: hypothetical protein IT442_01710 [Phycisphaeraceae bacterium]|nr:hypothetical protein [Phycisphaeraceae bacterium]
MSKHPPTSDRSQLPAGWGWAVWSESDEVKTVWANLDEKVRQALRQRFMEIDIGRKSGKPLPWEKVHYTDGIGKAKLRKPNPGWRAFFFRDGNTHYVTHIHRKDNDHDKHIESAKRARAEHLSRREQQ